MLVKIEGTGGPAWIDHTTILGILPTTNPLIKHIFTSIPAARGSLILETKEDMDTVAAAINKAKASMSL